jgi:hypothetical protein
MAVEADTGSRTRWWTGGLRGAIALASVVLTVTVVGLWQVVSRGSHLLCEGGLSSLCRPAEVAGGKHAYVSANERLVDQLPVFPGARRLTTTSSPYTLGDDPESPIDGYATTAAWSVPPRATPHSIVGFYAAHLRGWKVERDFRVDLPNPDSHLGLSLIRGSARVGLHVPVREGSPVAGSTVLGNRFTIAADHDQAKDG